MKTGKMVPYLFVSAPILESYVRMHARSLVSRKGGAFHITVVHHSVYNSSIHLSIYSIQKYSN